MLASSSLPQNEIEKICKTNKALAEYFAMKAELEQKYGVKFGQQKPLKIAA